MLALQSYYRYYSLSNLHQPWQNVKYGVNLERTTNLKGKGSGVKVAYLSYWEKPELSYRHLAYTIHIID